MYAASICSVDSAKWEWEIVVSIVVLWERYGHSILSRLEKLKLTSVLCSAAVIVIVVARRIVIRLIIIEPVQFFL